ncbi:MAG: gliding motility-associated C-terminal domain-containing protein [Crocinitomicaceae bacterium]|nr:gliding motility-associated C-terminal domain-containing protein [Crocinitomicaceae bacterium]
MKYIFLLATFLFVGQLDAQVYTVMNTNDAGAGSLRWGIESAVPGTTIYFDPGIAGQTITLLSEIAPTASVFIYGQNNDMTISGGGTTRMFNITGTYDFKIFNVTLENGFSSNGAAIYGATGAVIHAEDVLFINNQATNDGGAIRGLSATFTFKNCAFVANEAGSFGGGHSQVFGNCTMENVLFSGNKAGYGGGMYLRCNSTLINLTISGNFANTFGGAIYMYSNTAVDIYNSISFNNATSSNPPGMPASFFELENGSVINIGVQNCLIQGSGGSGSWNSAFGFDLGGNIDTNPLFVNPVPPSSAPSNTGDYHTNVGSTAQNSGLNAMSTLPVDLDGHPRIVNGVIDMGAFEYCNTFSSGVVNVCYSYNSPGGNVYNASGTYQDTIANMMGCDSIITTILNVNSTYNTLTETHCESLTSPSGLYTWTTSGVYQDTIPNMVSCDSVLTYNLTILNNSFITISPTACNSYFVPSGSYTITTSGTYNDTIPNVAGCDSVITINATINYQSTGSIVTTECTSYTSPSGNYTWTSTGTYNDTIPNMAGCDSLIVVQLTIIGPVYNYLSDTACESYTSASGNYVWTTSGIHTDTIPSFNGCDSIIVVNLIINNPTYSNINAFDCSSYTSPSGNYTWNSSGVYSDTIVNAAGCDSIITINLNIPGGMGTVDTLICSPYTSPSGNYSWDQNGTYYDTLSTTWGCDSIIQINIQAFDADNYVFFDGSELSTNFSSGNFSWIWCDSAVILTDISTYTPDQAGDYALIVDNGNCIDTSNCIGVNKDYSTLTGFSPNGDGVNDVLKLPVADENNSVTIFNRWGDEIITIDGYNNLDVVWDGTDKGGNIIAGTYYYVITGSTTKAGWVQLLK